MLLSAGHSPCLRTDIYQDAFQILHPPHPLWAVALPLHHLPGEQSLSFGFNLDERIHIPHLFLPLKSAMYCRAVPAWSLCAFPRGCRGWFAAGQACELLTGGREGMWTSGLRHHLPVGCKWWRHIVWWFTLLWSFFTASSWWANGKNCCH